MLLEQCLSDLGLGRHADVDRASIVPHAAGASTCARRGRLTRRVTTKLLGKSKWRALIHAKNTVRSETADERDDVSAPRDSLPSSPRSSLSDVNQVEDDKYDNERASPGSSAATCGSETEVDDGGREVVPLSEGTVSHEKNGSADAATSAEHALACEVGRNAEAYLEECFCTEAATLDRKKFESIPEITKADFKITEFLGKGSYCDALEVVCKGNRSTSSNLKFALKCLRPQVGADAEQFYTGAEDIIHETAQLANLDHRNIIKLHGRASGSVTEAFASDQGYFILLDRLDETLQDRMDVWKQAGRTARGPTAAKISVARDVADAGAYLHAKRIVLRDIKPANIGFDAAGVTKLFDFGFAVGLPDPDEANPASLLYDRCGTMRYMAPEIGQGKGYGTPADVYSLGVLLWELCALERPFSAINTVGVFEREVFGRERRPALDVGWPAAVRELLRRCWSAAPGSRPSMSEVESSLSLFVVNG